MNKEQLFNIQASAEIGNPRERKPINLEPLFANGRHKAAAKATEIIHSKFPEAMAVKVVATALN